MLITWALALLGLGKALSFSLNRVALREKISCKAALVELAPGEFDNEVTKESEVVIVDFYADWCGPCKLMGPIFKQLAEELPADGLKFVKVDTDVHESTVESYNIQGLPLFGVFIDGKMISSHSGALSKVNLRQFIIKSLLEHSVENKSEKVAKLIDSIS